MFCDSPVTGMFCKICQKYGKPPATARGAWTSRGVTDWNHATELLKLPNQSKWHQDGVITSRMAEQAQRTGSATYYLAKDRIPHTTCFQDLIELQIENGDEVLRLHSEGPSNAQYTSKFSQTEMIEAISKWIAAKLNESLKSSSFFSILADECEDVSTQEELSICCRWVVNGHAEEHFMTILHITSLTAEALATKLTNYLESTELEYRKLIGQGYDGAAPFSGKNTGVQKRVCTLSGHALYIHCSCHRLQLASIQAADSIPWIHKMFGVMANLWKLFFYSPKKAEKLKELQSVLGLPELKIVKPSSTRWLSHERCMKAIRKELPALILTLQDLYETSGDAEAFGIQKILSSFGGVTAVILLGEISNLLASLNCFMQKKAADFSR